jgi:hypothetical protein
MLTAKTTDGNILNMFLYRHIQIYSKQQEVLYGLWRSDAPCKHDQIMRGESTFVVRCRRRLIIPMPPNGALHPERQRAFVKPLRYVSKCGRRGPTTGSISSAPGLQASSANSLRSRTRRAPNRRREARPPPPTDLAHFMLPKAARRGVQVFRMG